MAGVALSPLAREEVEMPPVASYTRLNARRSFSLRANTRLLVGYAAGHCKRVCKKLVDYAAGSCTRVISRRIVGYAAGLRKRVSRRAQWKCLKRRGGRDGKLGVPPRDGRRREGRRGLW